MFRLLFCIFVFFASSSTLAHNKVELVYAGMNFEIPGGFSVVGDAGGEDNILIFRYGDVKGQNFLAFADMTEDRTIDYGCAVRDFYGSIFSGKEHPDCNSYNIEVMRKIFVEDAAVKRWSRKGYDIYISRRGEKTFAFVSAQDGDLVKVDSDFISFESFEGIFSKL